MPNIHTAFKHETDDALNDIFNVKIKTVYKTTSESIFISTNILANLLIQIYTWQRGFEPTSQSDSKMLLIRAYFNRMMHAWRCRTSELSWADSGGFLTDSLVKFFMSKWYTPGKLLIADGSQ